MKIHLFFILLLGLLPSTQCLACDFDCTLKKHLDAIQAKDFESFEQTLTKGDRLTFILPNGKFTQDTQAYKKMLKDWFAQEGWSLDYQIVAIEKTEKMGSALLLMAYDKKIEEESPII